MICHSPVWDMIYSPMNFWFSLFGKRRILPGDDDVDDDSLSGKAPVEVITFRTPPSSCASISASTVAKTIRHSTRKVDLKQRRKDRFLPQPSALALRAFGPNKLASDEDIWVECYFLNKRQQPRYYYRSFNTGRCVPSEPPSGAQTVVYQRDLLNSPPDIQKFAQQKLSRASVLELKEERRKQVQSLKGTSLLSNLIPDKGPLRNKNGLSRQ